MAQPHPGIDFSGLLGCCGGQLALAHFKFLHCRAFASKTRDSFAITYTIGFAVRTMHRLRLLLRGRREPRSKLRAFLEDLVLLAEAHQLAQRVRPHPLLWLAATNTYLVTLPASAGA